MTLASLIFVSTNESHVLIPALESLKNDPPDLSLEIVVVDNSSSDDVAIKVKAVWPEAIIIRRTSRFGLPSNLNAGIREATGDYIMLCNSDLLFQKGAINELVTFLDDHPNAGICAPLLTSPEGEPRASARRWYSLPVLIALKGPWKEWTAEWKIIKKNVYAEWDMNTPLLADWVPCPATMFRAEAFRDVGLMDERFRLYFDDVDISFRMHEKGWEVWCNPAARIVHLEQRSSVAAFSRPWFWHLSSLVKFFIKHRSLRPRRSKLRPLA